MSESWGETGYRSRFRPEPDGLELRCPVCKAEPGEYCWNPLTNPRKHRRLNVSCLGRKERHS